VHIFKLQYIMTYCHYILQFENNIYNHWIQLNFGADHLPLAAPCSPGPCHYPDAKMLRNGRDDRPQYTIYSRLPELPRLNVPAPGTYASVTPSQTSARSPAYSFGMICPPIVGDRTPGESGTGSFHSYIVMYSRLPPYLKATYHCIQVHFKTIHIFTEKVR